jgi:hypothetical protein
MATRRALLAGGLAVGLALPVAAEDGLADLVGRLAEEKGHAENGVAQLKRWVRKPAAVAQGRRLYDEAKIASDGAIAHLLAALTLDEEPGKDAALRARLDAAAEKRLAFSRHVDASLPPEVRGRKNVIGDALGKVAGEIVKGLITAAVDVWKTLRAADTTRRDTLRHQVEFQRWKAFGEVAAG